MRIGQAIIIPAILALGVAGSAVAGSAIAVAAGHVSVSQTHHTSASMDPNLYYHI